MWTQCEHTRRFYAATWYCVHHGGQGHEGKHEYREGFGDAEQEHAAAKSLVEAAEAERDALRGEVERLREDARCMGCKRKMYMPAHCGECAGGGWREMGKIPVPMERYADAIEDPMGIIERIQRGTAAEEDFRVLCGCYTSLLYSMAIHAVGSGAEDAFVDRFPESLRDAAREAVAVAKAR